MRRTLVLAAVFALTGLAVAMAAQTTPPALGAIVKDVQGRPIGVVDKLVTAADGSPRQVLVKDGRLLRPLPIDGLTLADGAYTTVLTKAEFEALPPLE